jgi:hypothetical protein
MQTHVKAAPAGALTMHMRGCEQRESANACAPKMGRKSRENPPDAQLN